MSDESIGMDALEGAEEHRDVGGLQDVDGLQAVDGPEVVDRTVEVEEPQQAEEPEEAEEPVDPEASREAWAGLTKQLAERNKRSRARRKAMPEPLAAFQLGLLPHDALLESVMTAGASSAEGQVATRAVIGRLQESLVALRGRIKARDRGVMIGVLNLLKNHVDLRTPEAEAMHMVQQLRELADGATDEQYRYRPWQGLGMALGDYRRALYAYVPYPGRKRYRSPDGAIDAAPVPDFAAVATAVASLCDVDCARVPPLRSLAGLREGQGKLGSSELLAMFIAENQETWASQLEGVNGLTLNSMTSTLVEEVLKVLASEARIPIWNKKTGMLQMQIHPEDKELTDLRPFIPKQGNVIALITEEFERLRWPAIVDDPVAKGNDSAKLNAAVKSLNKGLEHIRFHALPGGKRVRWAWLPRA